MKALVLATVAALALGLGGAGTAHAWDYSGTTMSPQGPIYYPDYSVSSSYTVFPRYTPTPEHPRYPGASYRPGGMVVRAQLALRRDGLYRGNIDGILGPETSEALADFQQQHGLQVTGSLDPETMASLGIGPR